MTVTIMPGKIAGKISAIPSKSHLHRLLIYAALADKETKILCANTEAEDIKATIGCLEALGAEIKRQKEGFIVKPVDREYLQGKSGKTVILPCMESGSTLRFMLPVVCALGVNGAFHMEGRLPKRPMAPLDAQLQNHGIKLWNDTPEILCCKGQLTAGEYELPGDVSSQYITGLLMALPLLTGCSCLTVTGTLESADYINMTLEAAEVFGCKPNINQNIYNINWINRFVSIGEVSVEGDWSNGAFWLCGGAMPGGDIQMCGLKKDSSQGDKAVSAVLSQMKANVNWKEDTLHVSEGERNQVEIDARATPDLIPVLAAVAALGEGTTFVKNAARLRLKESDRLLSTAKTLTALGADVEETEDGLKINGKPKLKGGTVDAFGDHRIAMTAAIASAGCTEPVTVTGAQAVNKSYPAFWDDLAFLGKEIKVH